MTMRSTVRYAGTAVLVVGLLVVLWGFATWRWGDPVTSVYTWWEQRELRTEYEHVASSYRDPAPPTRAPSAVDERARMRQAARKMRKSLESGQPVGRLRIHRLGLDAIVVNGTASGDLRRGPGRDTRTYLPGEGQLVYIAGHRTTFGAPFARIDQLKPGDKVVLDMPYGRFVYSVTSSVIVPADDIDRLKSRGREEIALQACHPRFSARERYIVYARPAADNGPS